MKNPVTRDGLGYVWSLTNEGVEIRADRLRESSGELTAELRFALAPQGHVYRTRLNLLAGQTRSSVAKELTVRAPGPAWRELLERFCDGVVELEREGAPFVMIGRAPIRPAPPFLMRPMLFVGKPTILFGEGGVGKSSAVAAAVAVSVASGVAALDAWSVVTSGPVLVLDWEGDGDDWNDAVARVAAGMHIDPPALHYRRMSGALDGQVNEIAAYCDEQGIVLVVIDSVTWAAKSMDRAPADEPVKRLFDALRMIGRTSLLIDHKSKAGIRDGDDGSNPIGSIVKVNAARAAYELRVAGPASPDGTRHLALIARKLNPTAPQPPLGIAVATATDSTTMWTEPVLLGDHVVVNEAKRSNVLWERIRDLLIDGVPRTAANIASLLGIDAKDPVRVVETAMSRKPLTFANNGVKVRSDRLWHLLVSGEVSEQDNIILFPGMDVSETPPAPAADPQQPAPEAAWYDEL